MASDSTVPPAPSGGGAKYAIIGVALFAIALLAYCLTSGGDEQGAGTTPVAQVDAGVIERSTALVEDEFEIPEPEPDAGPPPDAGRGETTHRTRPPGTTGSWDQCSGDIPVPEVRRVFAEYSYTLTDQLFIYRKGRFQRYSR